MIGRVLYTHKKWRMECATTHNNLNLVDTIRLNLRGMAEKFVDTISIFNRKINSVKMNISRFAKIFHEQIDEIL